MTVQDNSWSTTTKTRIYISIALVTSCKLSGSPLILKPRKTKIHRIRELLRQGEVTSFEFSSISCHNTQGKE